MSNADDHDMIILEGEIVSFLTVDEVIELHEDVIAEHSPGESRAILNHGLLESAVMTPQQSFGGELLCPTIEDMAAAYMAGLALNHSFENGNKRIALAVGATFLRMNGYQLVLSQDEAEKLILDLVTHVIDREEAAAIIRSGMVLL